MWEAVSPTGATVAYKVFRPDPNSPHLATERARFLREIRTQSKLSHPHIVGVIEDGADADGNPFYVMEWADGSLEDLLSKSPGGLPLDRALEIFESICEAMSYAHDQGVLHRDLKTQNILIFKDVPRVADFGLVRDLSSNTSTFTQSALGWGSLFYMAPEQTTALHLADKRSDVYSMGKILYAATTGRHPFYGFDIGHAPDRIQYLLLKCTESDPDDRFADCTELLSHLRAVIGADASTLAPPTDQALAALQSLVNGDNGAISRLSDIFLQYPNDSTLYTKILAGLPDGVIRIMALQQPQRLQVIVQNFDIYAEGPQPWDFCDVIADFYARCFAHLDHLPTRNLILKRLLPLGYSHNRWHVGEVFARLCAMTYSQTGYPELIAHLLEANPAECNFVRPYFQQYSNPPIVQAALYSSPG